MGIVTTNPASDDPRLEMVPVKSPFVTIVVTNYNYARYIIPCLESIAKQTYKAFKCVVVDDCSSDGSPILIEDFVKSEIAGGRFAMVKNEKNVGQLGSFAFGLLHAEGPFLAYVDADDLLLENFIEEHLNAHLSFEPVAFTSSNQYQINEFGELIGGRHSDHKARGEFRYVASRSIYDPFWVWATTSSIMFRRSVLELIMPESFEQFRVCADNYICHFANLMGGSLLIPSIHGCYRRHGRNNFGCNSMVGGCHPVGDLANHPKHHVVKRQVFHTLCKKSDQFIPLLGIINFRNSLVNTIGPLDIIRYSAALPTEIKKLPLLTRSVVFWLKGKMRKARALLRGDFKKFEYSDEVRFLRFPGEI